MIKGVIGTFILSCGSRHDTDSLQVLIHILYMRRGASYSSSAATYKLNKTSHFIGPLLYVAVLLFYDSVPFLILFVLCSLFKLSCEVRLSDSLI